MIETGIAELASRDTDFWPQITPRIDGRRVMPREILQFVKERELTHRQRLFRYLRLKAVVPATTRRRQAGQKGMSVSLS